MRRSIKSNFLYNTLLTGFNALLPLITYPYVTRVLGPENLGKVNFFSSISDWIIFLLTLGIPVYGIREIAKVRDNKQRANQVFSEMFVILFISMLFFVSVYFLLFTFNRNIQTDVKLFLIFLFPIITSFFSTDWLFGGFERYDYIAVRSIILKLIYVIFVFLLVNDENDYVIFAFLTAGIAVGTNLLNLVFSRAIVNITFKGLTFKRHVKPLVTVYGSILLGSIYSRGDIVLLGLFGNAVYVAYYNLEKKVIQLLSSITAALSTVLIPRLSYLIGTKQENEYQLLLSKSFSFILFISVPMVGYVILFHNQIVRLLGGEEFSMAGQGLTVMAPVFLFTNVLTFVGSQIMMPTGNEKKLFIMTIVSAVTNIVLNMFLITRFHHIGTSISIVVSEFLGLVVGLFLVKQHIKKIIINVKNLNYFIVSFLVAIFCFFLLRSFRLNEIITIVFGTLLYFICYMVILLIEKDQNVVMICKIILGRRNKYESASADK